MQTFWSKKNLKMLLYCYKTVSINLNQASFHGIPSSLPSYFRNIMLGHVYDVYLKSNNLSL